MAEKANYVKPIRIGPGKFSYLNIIVPRSFKDMGKKEFSFDFLFKKEEGEKDNPKSNWSIVRNAEREAIRIALENKVLTKSPKEMGALFTIAMKDGDEKLDSQGQKDPLYKGYWYLKCHEEADRKDRSGKITNPPVLIRDLGIADQRANPDISDLIWSGMEGYCTLTLKVWNNGSKAGISCYINSIIKTGDGERIGNSHNAANDYSDIYADQDETTVTAAPTRQETDDLGL